MVLIAALITAIVAAVVVGGVVAHLLWRRVAEASNAAETRADAGRDETVSAAVDAAVQAVLDRAGHTLAEERKVTLHSAVDAATKIASSKLSDTIKAGSSELDLRSRTFEQHVTQVQAEMAKVRDLVTALQKQTASESGSLKAELKTELEAVSKTQRRLAEHTDALRAALASPKQRGQWGERMAEDVLAAAGMKEGVQYLRQAAIESGSIPDFRFLLPNEVELRMDVKFPIDNYLRVLEAPTDDEITKYTKSFLRDVRNRIKELGGRGYIDARDTVDCLLLFIPNEAVYGFLLNSDPAILDDAMAQQVVLCSPATLFGVLAVIRRSVEQFQLERTSDQILRALGGVTDEWGKFTASLDKVDKQLNTVYRTFTEELAGTRRRVFEKNLDTVDALRRVSAVEPGVLGAEGDDALIAPGPVDAALGRGEALVARKAEGDIRPLPFELSEEFGTDPSGSSDVPEAG